MLRSLRQQQQRINVLRTQIHKEPTARRVHGRIETRPPIGKRRSRRRISVSNTGEPRSGMGIAHITAKEKSDFKHHSVLSQVGQRY